MLKNNKKIPIKNYVYLVLILIISIFLVYYMYLWFIEYKKDQNGGSTINEIMQIINYNELDSYLVENKDAIIYATVPNTKNIKKVEKKLEKIIEQNNIINQILYLDVTNNKKKNNTYQILNTYEQIPILLVYKNNNLIDKYQINIDNYDTKEIKEFLTKNGVITND